MTRAACAAYPAAWWFPDEASDSPDLEQVRAICWTCPVRRECLDFALVEDHHGVVGTHGIYAGLTESQRSSLRRRVCVGCFRHEDPAGLWAKVGNWRPSGTCGACDQLRSLHRSKRTVPVAIPPPPGMGAEAEWWPNQQAVISR